MWTYYRSIEISTRRMENLDTDFKNYLPTRRSCEEIYKKLEQQKRWYDMQSESVRLLIVSTKTFRQSRNSYYLVTLGYHYLAMHMFTPILDYIGEQIALNEEEQRFFISVLRIKKIDRKQFLEQPGHISKFRSFIVKGAFRAYFIDVDGQNHTISLAVENGWTGDPGSFLLQEQASLFVEALEDSILIQWSYESEQLLLKQIPQFARVMLQRAQFIAVMLQRRIISNLSLSAEARYEEFASKNPTLLQRFPLYVIASYLGMSREFLSKIRNQKIHAKL
jgi:CRP-like cAMP-binding protein